jgi:D-alanyl-D-alanine carboxypeptidase/D-alanyl-D-alanine-endopeptidase (penicillin-binding protein 4)
MRVDVVASPVRYRKMPLFLLLVVAVLPAIGLLSVHWWLRDEADRYDATRSAVESLSLEDDDRPAASRREIERAERTAVLSTSVFDYRRMPDGVAGSASTNRLEAQVAAALPFIDDRSCAAVSVDGISVGAVNETLSVIPASTVKLIVAAVALEVLGVDYTYETTVRIPSVVDGVVEGDIYLVGGGDPLLTSDDYSTDDETQPAFATTSLDVLADALVTAGVERINGAVIGDGTRYDDEFVIDSWGEGVAFNDAGPYDALLVNDARVRGRSGVQDDPNVAAAREFARLLADRGIGVSNGWGSGEASTLTTVVGTVESQPLGEIIREMLTNSDNNTAELLVKELGFAESGEGTRFAGLVAIDRALRQWGVPLDGVRLLDGSGLTPTTQMTCQALLDVLQRSRGTSLPTSLPIAGETGTLRDEFIDTGVEGRLFAKTGTLGNPPSDEPPLASKALAGYVSGGNGATIEFVVVLNGEEITEENYRLIWAVFGQRFATFPEGPPAEDLQPR